MNEKLIQFSDFLERESFSKSASFPVDRYFLETYIEIILSFDSKDFIACNLNRQSNTYTVQLLLCLPELWEDIDIDDMISIIERFSNEFSYYTLIEFCYKYVRVNVIELLLSISSIPKETKVKLLDYLVLSFYPNLVMTEGDILFFEAGIYGIRLEDWNYVHQRLLVDDRVSPALSDINEVYSYVSSLKESFVA